MATQFGKHSENSSNEYEALEEDTSADEKTPKRLKTNE